MVNSDWGTTLTLTALVYAAWKLRRKLGGSKAPPDRVAPERENRGTNARIGAVECLHCGQVLRIGLPPPSNVVECPRCGRYFTIVLWDSGKNLYLSPADEDLLGPGPNGARTERQQFAPLLAALDLDPAVPPEALSLREIRKAYYRGVQRYHPDKYAQLPVEFQRVAERKTRDLHRAYQKLMELKQAKTAPPPPRL